MKLFLYKCRDTYLEIGIAMAEIADTYMLRLVPVELMETNLDVKIPLAKKEKGWVLVDINAISVSLFEDLSQEDREFLDEIARDSGKSVFILRNNNSQNRRIKFLGSEYSVQIRKVEGGKLYDLKSYLC